MKAYVVQNRLLTPKEVEYIFKTANTWSEQIRIARKILGWTQEELAFRSTENGEPGVSVSTISRVENNKTNPRMSTIISILKALGAMALLNMNLQKSLTSAASTASTASSTSAHAFAWFLKCKNLSEALRAGRKQHGLTQKELASRSNLSLRTIKYYENRKCNSRLSSLSRLEAVLGLPTGVLCAIAA